MELYMVKIQEYERMQNLQTKFQELTKSEQDKKFEASGVSKLRSKISEAESICLSEFANVLEHHVQVYLDDFFPLDPMTINLVRYKKFKSSKKQFQVFCSKFRCVLDWKRSN